MLTEFFSFLRYKYCLADLKKRLSIQECEVEHEELLSSSENSGQCRALELLNTCIYDKIVAACGFQGWDTYYKVIALHLGSRFSGCRFNGYIHEKIHEKTKKLLMLLIIRVGTLIRDGKLIIKLLLCTWAPDILDVDSMEIQFEIDQH